MILAGHSMAGWVALLAAKRMPGTVGAVIGVDTLQNAEVKLPEEVRKSILDGVDKDASARFAPCSTGSSRRRRTRS